MSEWTKEKHEAYRHKVESYHRRMGHGWATDCVLEALTEIERLQALVDDYDEAIHIEEERFNELATCVKRYCWGVWEGRNQAVTLNELRQMVNWEPAQEKEDE